MKGCTGGTGSEDGAAARFGREIPRNPSLGPLQVIPRRGKKRLFSRSRRPRSASAPCSHPASDFPRTIPRPKACRRRTTMTPTPSQPRIHIERMMHRSSIAVAGDSAASYALVKLIPAGGGASPLALNLALVLDVTGSLYEEDGPPPSPPPPLHHPPPTPTHRLNPP